MEQKAVATESVECLGVQAANGMRAAYGFTAHQLAVLLPIAIGSDWQQQLVRADMLHPLWSARIVPLS